MATPESVTLSAWYGSRPEIRRLWAVRDAQGLRVVVDMEPANDSGEVHPAWMANRAQWADELQVRAGARVRLERADDPCGDEVATGLAGVIVAAFAWRDPSFS